MQSHWTPPGAVLLDRVLPQDEQRLRELIAGLRSRGRVLFVVDQPATIGALPLVSSLDRSRSTRPDTPPLMASSGAAERENSGSDGGVHRGVDADR